MGVDLKVEYGLPLHSMKEANVEIKMKRKMEEIVL